MAFLIYIIALVITVLLMRVADMVRPSGGDIRIAVFLGILFIVNFVLGMVPLGSPRRNP
jgi:fucose 4-O-acetylase-like acetyltransferase